MLSAGTTGVYYHEVGLTFSTIKEYLKAYKSDPVTKTPTDLSWQGDRLASG
jgi:hypothetical protein